MNKVHAVMVMVYGSTNKTVSSRNSFTMHAKRKCPTPKEAKMNQWYLMKKQVG